VAALDGLPALRRLTVEGAFAEVGELGLPALEELIFAPNVLTAEALAGLGRARLPALRRLELHFECPADFTDIAAGPDDLKQFLAEAALPGLRVLAICAFPYETEIVVRTFAGAPLAAQLEAIEIPDANEDLVARLARELPCRVRGAVRLGEPNPVDDEICRDPDSVAPYLVYADWLEERGAPLAELIRVQHALARQPSAALRRRERELVRRHGLLGEIPADQLEARWHLGHLRAVSVTVGREDDWVAPTLLELPVARYLRELWIEGYAMEPELLARVLGGIRRVGPPCLRLLRITGARGEISVAELAGSLSSLRRLVVARSIEVRDKVPGCEVRRARDGRRRIR
jgi:uncharacterized protein (TIGR02996 family)